MLCLCAVCKLLLVPFVYCFDATCELFFIFIVTVHKLFFLQGLLIIFGHVCVIFCTAQFLCEGWELGLVSSGWILSLAGSNLFLPVQCHVV